MTEVFEEFLRRRREASDAWIRGDAAPLSELLTINDPATFLPPGGAIIEHAGPARDAQVAGARAFGPASTGRFEILHSGSSGDLAYWTGRQVAEMDVKGEPERVAMTLRVTEIFRREEDAWRLVHRHADLVD